MAHCIQCVALLPRLDSIDLPCIAATHPDLPAMDRVLDGIFNIQSQFHRLAGPYMDSSSHLQRSPRSKHSHQCSRGTCALSSALLAPLAAVSRMQAWQYSASTMRYARLMMASVQVCVFTAPLFSAFSQPFLSHHLWLPRLDAVASADVGCH